MLTGKITDFQHEDFQSPALKKVPALIDMAYYFRTAIRHECPVSGSLNSYSYGRFGSGGADGLTFILLILSGSYQELFPERNELSQSANWRRTVTFNQRLRYEPLLSFGYCKSIMLTGLINA